ncbi:hypothetical protein AVEN_206112-1 [Araneus ventricosus]|uniref:Uncharacterized protein n=1 Tax=Araneus ventricosus TaxID=182803 RepID=A0A4Y2R3S1_ARAVE|nr:hypothetical protein AVEN_206112-1 [Araneus ventricosus]
MTQMIYRSFQKEMNPLLRDYISESAILNRNHDAEESANYSADHKSESTDSQIRIPRIHSFWSESDPAAPFEESIRWIVPEVNDSSLGNSGSCTSCGIAKRAVANVILQ